MCSSEHRVGFRCTPVYNLRYRIEWKMASGYQLRSLTAVAEHLDRRKRNWTHDRPSADETDYEEELTDTESEEDADDPAFEPSSAAGCIYLVAGQKDKNCL
ncbi:uncharacterized protein LOC117172630 isoform X1 [Belonocnema kinseyi]|uniref:uncharacterized protein LOC117172630 isoform X1 n=1 Tax=Belonocnema kinseyi TaxID=2817044 RepID=UPI00143CE3D5|nr:uncharacterized protein LOC117172630 isoform X1 [Belonocnema kinseyi]